MTLHRSRRRSLCAALLSACVALGIVGVSASKFQATLIQTRVLILLS